MPVKPQPSLDPYLTLGLQPGATQAEVKRAYRRLAKEFHPDSAGEQAVSRFLAIQAAYEQIRTGRVTLGGSRGARSTGTAPAAEPWRADPARARAARERARTAGGGAGARTSGSSAGGSGAASGSGAAGGQGTGGRRSTGTSGSATGARKRATRKATMGSTSYDEARDPADATWSGASWYGPSTGEYWIVNPREYADPRKHGPDYQQRARRPLGESIGDQIPRPLGDVASREDEEPDAAARPAASARSATGARRDAGPTTSAGAATAEPDLQAARERRARPAPRWASNATESGWAAAGEARPEAASTAAPGSAPLRWLGEPTDDPVRRFGLALVAWPPIGLAAAALIGDATGCAGFGAQCDGAEPMLPWLAQAVILGLLLLLAPLTRILATGTVAVLIGLVPVTMLLVAVGASGAPQAAPTLIVLLGVVWLVGVAWAVALRVRRPGAAT